MTTSYTQITAIILNYNSSNETITLYNSLKTIYPTVKVLIIDNFSNNSEVKNLKKNIPQQLLILNKTNVGFAAGNNIGIKRAIKEGAKYILLLNPDIEITASFLPILTNTIENNANIAAIGPRICYANNKNLIYSDGGIVNKTKGFYTNHINYNVFEKDCISNNTNNVDYVNGSALLFQVAALNKIGLLLEDFFLYFEETEWCLRAKDKGYNLVVNTEAKVYHKSSKKGKLYKFYMVRNRLLLAKLRKEFVFKTFKEVGLLLLKDLKRELLNHKLTGITLYGLKGYIFGIFKTVKK